MDQNQKSKEKNQIEKYIPSKIEGKWQEWWDKNKIYPSDATKPDTHYVLAEFAYPSGDLHMGHWFTFSGADIYARLKRMQGKNVFFPNGFDAFGLPAENAAIKRNIHPQDWTMENVKRMKEQYKTMGASFSFKDGVITCLPGYYHWNQWIFIKMFEKGIAYRSSTLSNWCPVDQTVLANEHVENGKCWRCGAEVVQKEVEQWFLRITKYADRLLWPEIPSVDWPKAVREAQNDWIGKTKGTLIEFPVAKSDKKIKVFTTRADTLYGATFLVLAPELRIVTDIASKEQKNAVKTYQDQAAKKSELERKEMKEKIGVFTGAYAINPLNGEEIPIWIADYALAGYGTGALFGDAHDERDTEFAKKYNISLKPTLVTGDKARDERILNLEEVFLGYGTLVNSGEFSGLKFEEAKEKITEWLIKHKAGDAYTVYHLHDWSVSRQRYWGTPVPMIHCKKCGIVPVPEKDLPVELPYDVDYAPKGKAPLASNEEWMKVKCPSCGGEAVRDPETLDTFFDSSWYFFRYIDDKNKKKPFEVSIEKNAMPVDIYFGGAEHTLGHTLYSRFFTKFFKDIGISQLSEYASKRVNHGVILGPDGNRMSKSKGNVVNPDDEVKHYGADTIRVYLAFFIPYESTGPWETDKVWGSHRFLQRVWALSDKIEAQEDSKKLAKEDLFQMHKAIKKVSQDIESVKYNTAVAALMEWLNHVSKKEVVARQEYEVFLKLLAPFAPHITEELWYRFKSEVKNKKSVDVAGSDHTSIHQQSWPSFDKKYLVEDMITIVIQVNGKRKSEFSISKDIVSDQKAIEELAKKATEKYLQGENIKKTIYVPGKIINFVV